MTHRQLLQRYLAKHKRLVEPNQGWESLHRSLHLAYSMGRKRSFYDVGTYANKPGDHSWGDRHGKPGVALAFDLRRKGWYARLGWGWANARRLARFYIEHADALHIEGVIVGRRYCSRNSGWRWVRLTTGDTSHDWHIHVWGVEPG